MFWTLFGLHLFHMSRFAQDDHHGGRQLTLAAAKAELPHTAGPISDHGHCGDLNVAEAETQGTLSCRLATVMPSWMPMCCSILKVLHPETG